MAYIPDLSKAGKPEPSPPVVIPGTNGKNYALPQVAVTTIAPGMIENIAKCTLFNLAAMIAASFNLQLVPKTPPEATDATKARIEEAPASE